VDLRAGLDDVKRKFLTLLGHELRSLGHPARSQSLYRLSYPGSLDDVERRKISLLSGHELRPLGRKTPVLWATFQ
jgi:hypothetical protein